jgi:hypothetical protein
MSATIQSTIVCDGKGCRITPGLPTHLTLLQIRRTAAGMGWQFVKHSQMDFCPSCWRIRLNERKTKP